MDKFPLGVPVRVLQDPEPSKWYVKRGLDKLKAGLSVDSKGRLSFDPFASATPPVPKVQTATPPVPKAPTAKTEPAVKGLPSPRFEAPKTWRKLSDPPTKEGMYKIRHPGGEELYVRSWDETGWLTTDGSYFTSAGVLTLCEWQEQ